MADIRRSYAGIFQSLANDRWNELGETLIADPPFLPIVVVSLTLAPKMIDKVNSARGRAQKLCDDAFSPDRYRCGPVTKLHFLRRRSACLALV